MGVDPVDILTRSKEFGLLKRLKTEKESECEKDVAELAKLACATLKKLMTDVNSAVAVESIQAIGNLALGLRTHFSANSQLMLPFLLKNLKEEEPTVAKALTKTVQAMYQAGSLNHVDIIEDDKSTVKNKVPRCLDVGTPEARHAAFSALVALVKVAANLTTETKATAVEAKASAAKVEEAANEASAFAAEVASAVAAAEAGLVAALD